MLLAVVFCVVIINSIMDILAILTQKPHNLHWLTRYYAFIVACQTQNKKNHIEKGEIHHICPKAKDLFPEYKNLNQYKWNSVFLSYRQHFLAHWMLWKAYGGSQIYAFYSMTMQNQKNRQNKIKSSNIYETIREQFRQKSREQNQGMAVYINSKGEKIRTSTSDPMVISGELVSASKGRKYAPRSIESRRKSSLINKGKVFGPMTMENRMARRNTSKNHMIEYYDPTSNQFIRCDPLFANETFIKVWTLPGRPVWDAAGRTRWVDRRIPETPVGYFNSNQKMLYKVIDLSTMEYQEVIGADLPKEYYILNRRKGRKTKYYIPHMNKYISIESNIIEKYGVPGNLEELRRNNTP